MTLVNTMSWSILSSEIIHTILIQLPFPDIVNYLCTCHYASTLHDDTYFWLKKLDYDLQCMAPDSTLLIPSYYVNVYRHREMLYSGYKIYKEWSVLNNYEIHTDDYICEIYKTNNHDDIIIFLLDKIRDIQLWYINQVCDLAIKYGSINVLEKIETLDKTNPTQYHAIKACQYGHLHVLQWFTQRKKLSNNMNIDIIIKNGYLHIILWLHAHNYINELTPHHAVIAAKNNHINILDWLQAQGILPSPNAVILAEKNGALQSLIWLAQRNILPNQIIADNAALHDHIPVLEWLQTTYNILPGSHIPDRVAQKCNIKMLEWLSLRDLLPSRASADYAAKNGKIYVLLWLDYHGIYATVKGANHAAQRGHLNIIKCLAYRDIYPDDIALNKARHRGKVRILQFLRFQRLKQSSIVTHT